MTRTAAGKLLLLFMLGAATPAWSIFKCEADGKVSYTDTPCDGGKFIEAATTAPADATHAIRQATQEKRRKAQKMCRARAPPEAGEPGRRKIDRNRQ